MTLSLHSLANAFYIGSAAIGLPSVAGLVISVVYYAHRWLTPAHEPAGSVKNPDAILMILGGITRVFEGMATVVRFLGKYLVGGIAVLATAGLVLAIGLFFTARGLHAHQAWARGAAGLLIGALTLGCLVVLLSTRGWPFVLATILAAANGYVLVMLWRGFPA